MFIFYNYSRKCIKNKIPWCISHLVILCHFCHHSIMFPSPAPPIPLNWLHFHHYNYHCVNQFCCCYHYHHHSHQCYHTLIHLPPLNKTNYIMLSSPHKNPNAIAQVQCCDLWQPQMQAPINSIINTSLFPTQYTLPHPIQYMFPLFHSTIVSATTTSTTILTFFYHQHFHHLLLQSLRFVSEWGVLAGLGFLPIYFSVSITHIFNN